MSIAKSQYRDSSDHQEYKSQATTQPQAATQIDQPIQARFEPQNIFLSLVAFRLLNALTIKTFFQPDEYYQALEPAWKWTFGDQAGAWITWEWQEHLRSAIHPGIFAVIYRVANELVNLWNLDHGARTEILLVAPKIGQSVIAALGDLFTWKLARLVYGTNSTATVATLILTVISPWQWFASTRTFSNSLESTLTIIGLYNWPWHWSVPSTEAATDKASNSRKLRTRNSSAGDGCSTDEVTRLRRTLLCAALATVLRPTNLLIWMLLSLFTFVQFPSLSVTLAHPERIAFVCETILCGSTVLAFSFLIDRTFYGQWVFPPYSFLKVNVVESIAGFYGNNNWHYYVSQGYPLLLTTALPFTLIGFRSSLSGSHKAQGLRQTARNTLQLLSIVSLLVPFAFSGISHKEVRFIYPLLPALHIITAQPLSIFFQPLLARPSPNTTTTSSSSGKSTLVGIILSINLILVFYLTQIHNSGIITLPNYLRTEFSTIYLAQQAEPQNLTFALLMPCHSIPWRSHLQFPATSSTPGILGWALTCEPPLGLSPQAKETYLDEADVFYQDPQLWLKLNMAREPPRPPTLPDNLASHLPSQSRSPNIGVHAPDPRQERTFNFLPSHADPKLESEWWDLQPSDPVRLARRRPWPHYLAFFAHLESTVQSALRGSGYVECGRFFNSHAHDDARRAGDVVVWCLKHPSRERSGGLGS